MTAQQFGWHPPCLRGFHALDTYILAHGASDDAHLPSIRKPDDKLSDTDFTRLAHDYMQMMDWADMPYYDFGKHEDHRPSSRSHRALRVGTDGRCISDRK